MFDCGNGYDRRVGLVDGDCCCIIQGTNLMGHDGIEASSSADIGGRTS